MRLLLTSFALLALAALAGGCTTASSVAVSSIAGLPNASALEIHSHTEVRLQEANFVVTKTNVAGQSKGFSLLGILTIVPPKFDKAMSRLYTEAKMQPGRPQTLANLSVQKDSTYLLLFSLPRLSVRADVVEFTPAHATNTPSRPPPENVIEKPPAW